MGPSHLYTIGWTIQKNTEANTATGIKTNTYSTDTSIGTAGVISMHMRLLSEREQTARGKKEVYSTHRAYCDVYAITEKHRIKDPDGQIYDVVAVDNPHDRDIFMQIDCIRTDLQREDE